MKRKFLNFNLAAAALLSASACTPGADSSTEVMILAYQPNLKRYDRKTVHLETIDDIVTLKGSVARLVGGAQIDLDSSRPLKDQGHDVKLDLKDVDGVLVPADFHSLNMLTAYYNVEQSAKFYEHLNLNLSEFGPKTIYYFPTMTRAGAELKDNAFYISTMNAIAILPFDTLQKIPLGINLGAIGHEYTHAVIDFLATTKDTKSTFNDPTHSSHEAINVYNVIHEGIADFMGTAIACRASGDFSNCDPLILSASVEGQEDRRLSDRHCLPGELSQAGIKSDSALFLSQGLSYQGGTVLASSLWRALNDVGHTEDTWTDMAMALFKSAGADDIKGLRGLVAKELEEGKKGEFAKSDAAALTMKAALSSLVANMNNSKMKKAVCAAFLDRFYLKPGDLPECRSLNVDSNGECSRLKSAFTQNIAEEGEI